MREATIPPHSLEAEAAALSCLLFDSDLQALGVHMLGPADFYNHANAAIFGAIEALTKENVIADIVTLKSKLDEQALFDKIGGTEKIIEIVGQVSTSANFKTYVKTIQDAAYRRRCIKLADDVKALAYQGEFEKLRSGVDALQKNTVKTEDISPLPTVLEGALRKVEEFRQSGRIIRGVSTGFRDLDMKLGGLQNSDLIILAGRPSMGKTALALDMVKAAAKEFVNSRKIAVVFSLEMSKDKLALRVFSSELRIKNENFRFGTLTKDDYAKMIDKSAEFEKNMTPVFIDDEGLTKISDMHAKCHNMKVTTGKEIGLIMVDYMQLIRTTRNETNMNREMTEISRGLKLLAKAFDCPVLALSQLSRGTESRQDNRPKLSDLRESGAIEQDADVVMMIYRDEYYNPHTDKKGVAEIIITKQREGSTGTIELCFLGEYTTFKDLQRGRRIG